MAEIIQTINKVLKSIAEERSFTNYSIKIEPISSDGANYSSTLYNVTIEQEDNIHYMFVKVAALGETMRSANPEIYQTEVFAYTKLVKIYNSLQDEHQVPQEYRLILSEFYGCNKTLYKEIIVLENLVMKGYQIHDRFKSINWEYGASAMTELSKMHALSFAYSIYYPEDFNKVVDTLKFEWNIEKGHLSDHFATTSVKAIETVPEKNKAQLKRFFKTYGNEKYSQFYVATRRPVLAHIDFRTSNLMHRIRDDGTVEIKVVDLQTIQSCSPLYDILFFIVTGTDEQFRAEYYEKLLDHYYNELHEAMKRLDLDPESVYSRADFEYELKEKLPFGLIIAVMALPVVTVSTENAPMVNEDMTMSDFALQPPNDLYTERLNGIVNDYVKWGHSSLGDNQKCFHIINTSITIEVKNKYTADLKIDDAHRRLQHQCHYRLTDVAKIIYTSFYMLLA